MKYLFLLLWSMNLMANDKKMVVGYFPTTMPRDPAEIDIFLEHIGIGQVIETLVKIDSDGDIAPNLAESWKVLEHGTKFRFKLFPDIKFSNGNLLTCEDVIFTFQHHLKTNSQSKGYLKRIKKFECINSHELEIILETPQVSFLKVLTRDHLGIIPKDWKFNKTAKEPWIGTGPYRYISESSGSFFTKNLLFRNASEVDIEIWKVLKTNDVSTEAGKLDQPDLVLHTTKQNKNILEKNLKFADIKFQSPLHFVQTSVC